MYSKDSATSPRYSIRMHSHPVKAARTTKTDHLRIADLEDRVAQDWTVWPTQQGGSHYPYVDKWNPYSWNGPQGSSLAAPSSSRFASRLGQIALATRASSIYHCTLNFPARAVITNVVSVSHSPDKIQYVDSFEDRCARLRLLAWPLPGFQWHVSHILCSIRSSGPPHSTCTRSTLNSRAGV